MTSPKNDAVDEARALLGEYEQFLLGKARGTTDAYLRTARQLIGWLAQYPGHEGHFQPGQVTKTAVEQYLAHLKQEGFGLHHQARVKSSISTFANYLIEEKGLLQRNPTRAIELPPVPRQPRNRSRHSSARCCAGWSSKPETGGELPSSRWATGRAAG